MHVRRMEMLLTVALNRMKRKDILQPKILCLSLHLSRAGAKWVLGAPLYQSQKVIGHWLG